MRITVPVDRNGLFNPQFLNYEIFSNGFGKIVDLQIIACYETDLGIHIGVYAECFGKRVRPEKNYAQNEQCGNFQYTFCD